MELEFMSDREIGDEELFIYLDKDGMAALKSAIDKAVDGEHQHLFSKEWGGNGLTVTPHSSNSFNKVTITFKE